MPSDDHASLYDGDALEEQLRRISLYSTRNNDTGSSTSTSSRFRPPPPILSSSSTTKPARIDPPRGRRPGLPVVVPEHLARGRQRHNWQQMAIMLENFDDQVDDSDAGYLGTDRGSGGQDTQTLSRQTTAETCWDMASTVSEKFDEIIARHSRNIDGSYSEESPLSGRSHNEGDDSESFVSRSDSESDDVRIPMENGSDADISSSSSECSDSTLSCSGSALRAMPLGCRQCVPDDQQSTTTKMLSYEYSVTHYPFPTAERDQSPATRTSVASLPAPGRQRLQMPFACLEKMPLGYVEGKAKRTPTILIKNAEDEALVEETSVCSKSYYHPMFNQWLPFPPEVPDDMGEQDPGTRERIKTVLHKIADKTRRRKKVCKKDISLPANLLSSDPSKSRSDG